MCAKTVDFVVFLQHSVFVRIACQDDWIASRLKNSAKMQNSASIQPRTGFSKFAKKVEKIANSWGKKVRINIAPSPHQTEPVPSIPTSS